MLYSGPCGNYHRKETSPTTDDQTQLPPRTKRPHQLPIIKPSYHLEQKKIVAQAFPSGSEQSFPITYPSENIVPKSNLIPMVPCNQSKLQK